MTVQMDPWRPSRPDDDALRNFIGNIERTFAPLGGTISGAFDQDRTQRVFFQDIDSYMDVTYGPGGRPIVGRGSGFYVLPQIRPQYDKVGGALRPRETSAWDVLGQTVGRARESALLDDDPATKFSNFVNFEFGAGKLEDAGWGMGVQWLEPGYERMYPAPALSLLAKTYAAPEVPIRAAKNIYPDIVLMTQGRGGFHRAIKGEDFIEAGIPGGHFAGGAGKQQGTRMYWGGQMGRGEEQSLPWAGGQMRGQVMDVMFPFYQATSTIEGQALVRPGQTITAQQPKSVALGGWDIERVSGITGVGQGQFARGGEEFGLIYGAGGESLYSSREKHWSEVQIINAYISIPQAWKQSQWYTGLSERERGMFRPTGGVISGGEVVPSLEYEMRLTRGAGGTTSGKGGGFKDIFAERAFGRTIQEGLTPKELQNLDVVFQEAPKDWMTTIYGAGVGLGVIEPGQRLYTGTGGFNKELIGRITKAMEPHVRPVTTSEVVSGAQGAEYLYGNVPGVTARMLGSGQVELQRTAERYVGPMSVPTRLEYPKGRSVYSGEELEHYRLTNPSMYQRVMDVGQQSTAHQNILRAFWASHGKYDMPATRYQDAYSQVQQLAAGTSGQRGELLQSIAESELGTQAFRFSGGAVLPSARDILQLSTKDIAGEEVNQLVVSWERAVSFGGVASYMNRAPEALGQKGFLRTAMEVNAPGVMGPGTASSDINIGQVMIGRGQFQTMAREIFGRAPSKEQQEQLETLTRSGQIMTQLTRFPHSDPYAQQNVFLQLGLGWEKSGEQNIGPEEIAFHPYHAAVQHGDFDADLYRVTSLSLQQVEGGTTLVNNEWTGVMRGQRDQMEFMIQNLRETNPEAVHLAEQEALQRQTQNADKLAGLQGEQVQTMFLGNVIRLSQDYANEMAKHGEKETAMGLARLPGESAGEFAARSAMEKEPTIDAATSKMYETWQYKELMGRTYNTLIRDIGMRARQSLGTEAAQQVMSIGRSGYQRAIDTGIYDPTMPLGRAEAGRDPRISFGLARLMEAWGSQSFFHQGGFAETLTGGIKWNKNREEYRSPWHSGSGSPWNMARMVMGEFAMFGTEATPQQMSIAITGEETPALVSAIQKARQWIGEEGQQGMTAQDLLRTVPGQRHLGGIYKAAGFQDDASTAAARGTLPQAMFAMMSTRTREKLSRDPLMEAEWVGISTQYKHLTGRELASDMASSRLEQGTLEVLSGRTRHLGEGTLTSQILAMADVVPGPLGQGIRQGRGKAPTIMQDVWASHLGLEDPRRFAYMLESLTGDMGIEKEWGKAGTATHTAFEERFGEGFATEEEAKYEGSVVEFGVTEFGHVRTVGKPDIVDIRGETLSVFDVKTYDLDKLDPSQLMFYGAAMEKKYGRKVGRLAYLRGGAGVDEDLTERIVRGTASKGDLEMARKEGYLREIAVPEDLQDQVGNMLRSALRQQQRIAPLLQYLSNVEIEMERHGLEGGYTAWKQSTSRLYKLAKQNRALGRPGRFMPRSNDVLEALSSDFGIDLKELGVQGAQILSPREFLAEDAKYTDRAAGMTDKEVEESIAEMGWRAGFSRDGRITIRTLTEAELAKFGDDYNPYTIMRGRLAHEAGHAAYTKDSGLREAAQAAFNELDESDPFVQGLKKLYPENWREMGASELVAHRLQARFGATVGPLEHKGLSSFEKMIIKLAGRADIGRPGIATGGTGAGEGGKGPIYYQQGPSGAGGAGAGRQLLDLGDPQQLGQLLSLVRQAMYPDDKTMNWDKRTMASAFRVMMGEKGVLQEPGMVSKLSGGNYWEQSQYTAVQELQAYRQRGGGRPSWRMLNIHRTMRSFAQTEGGVDPALGLEVGDTASAMETFTGLMGGDREVQRMAKLMGKAADSLLKFDTALDSSTKTIKFLGENASQYNEAQKEVLGKMALGELGTAFRGAVRAAGPEFLETESARDAMGQLGLTPTPAQRLETGIQRVGRRAFGGYGLFTMRRLWGMFGAPTMQAQQTTAQQELSTAGAMASWAGGQAQMGPVAGGLMNIRAQQQRAQAAMGRGAWMAYGPVQQAMAGATGEAMGILGPAAGIGAVAGYMFGGPVGIAAGLGTAAIGAYNYLGAIRDDPIDMAMRATGTRGQQWSAAFAMATSPKRAMASLVEGAPLTGAIREGDMQALAGNIPAQQRALQEWAGRQIDEGGSFLDENQLMQMGGQWASYMGTQMLGELPTKLFEQLQQRGMDIPQVGALATQLGGYTSDMQRVAESLVAQPRSAATMRALGQYAPAGQLGLVGPGYFAGQMGQMQEMNAWQESRFGRMMGGDRRMWSAYGRGEDLGLTGTAMDILQQGTGGPADWMVTTDEIGRPLHTAELRDIQHRQMAGQDQLAISREQTAMAQFQRQYWMTTGQAMDQGEWMGGLPSELIGAVNEVGGLWGIQDRQREIQFGAHRRSRNYEVMQQAMGRNRFQTGYTLATGAGFGGLGGFASSELRALAAASGGMQGIQDRSRAAGYAHQMAGFGFQEQSLGISQAIFSTQQAQWGENWQSSWGRFQIQREWQDEDVNRRQERNVASDEWRAYQMDYRAGRTDIQYGRQMEDLDEGIRFATGRRRLQLMKQKERTTEDYSSQKGYQDAEKDYWEQQKLWRDEDLEKADDHREQINKWKEEDLLRSKRQHEELAGLQEAQFGVRMAQLEESKAYAQEQFTLESERIELERQAWEDNQKNQATLMREEEKYSAAREKDWQDQWGLQEKEMKIQRIAWDEYMQERGDDLELSQQLAVDNREYTWRRIGMLEDEQDKLATFQTMMGEMGGTIDHLSAKARSLRNIASGIDVGGGYQKLDDDDDPEIIQHEGGPVGIVPGSGNFRMNLEAGEYVVPKSGQLVFRDDDRVVELLARIAMLLEEGNGRVQVLLSSPEQAAREVANVSDAAWG